MSFRPTEYTVRQLLIEELRRRGVKVTPEISFVSPVGRLVPDLLLQNGGSYVVETKLGAKTEQILNLADINLIFTYKVIGYDGKQKIPCTNRDT